jgi:hypothetical protein
MHQPDAAVAGVGLELPPELLERLNNVDVTPPAP